tara:strand:+ start:2291 stop:3811 length:1521 start_codon:yes stop_codon:yes gene_type:complete
MSIGKITPISVMECVPGDSFNIKTTQLVRYAPLIAPVMHESSVYCHFFFVPNRILWPSWEEYITGGEDAADPGYVPPVFPYIELGGGTYEAGSLMDYLGLPTGLANGLNGTRVSPLPFYGYNKIFNEYYRDQNLVDDKPDTAVDGSNNATLFTGTWNECSNRAWQHDYFTSALPWTQKGPEATIPLGTDAPLVNLTGSNNDPNLASWLRNTQGDSETSTNITSASGIAPANGYITDNNSNNLIRQIDITNHTEVDLTDATASSINDLRRAFRLQEWLERNARGGSRYIEVILAHFGVQSSDARLQRPEFLGGSATPITISEVLQTSDAAAEDTPQGNMAGHGVSVGSSNYVSYKCEEHGYILGMMTIMPKSAYQQGIPKHFTKFDKFDYFWPSFANIGEQPIYNKELYADANDSNDEEVFGYTPRYAEYKYLPSTVHGEFRDSLDFWHMGRIFGSRPSLNATFVECQEDEVDRVFAVEEGDENLYVYLHNHVKARRPMPYFGTPTI